MDDDSDSEGEAPFVIPPSHAFSSNKLDYNLLKYHVGQELADLANGPDSPVAVRSVLWHVVQMQMRLTPEEWKRQAYPPLIKPQSFLYKTPYQHQKQISKDLARFQRCCDRGEKYEKYPAQIEREKAIDRIDKLQQTKKQTSKSRSQKNRSPSMFTRQIIDSNATAMRSWRPGYSCAVCLPVASGKTATMVIANIFLGLSVAYVTNENKNSSQVLQFILEHTNLAFYTSVNRICMPDKQAEPGRPDRHDRHDRHDQHDQHDQHVQTMRTPPLPLLKNLNVQHVFPGPEAGILIIDRNMLLAPMEKSQTNRVEIINQINGSDYDLLIIDEASDNATATFTEWEQKGVIVDGVKHDCFGKDYDSRIKIKYTMKVMLCGVFYRPITNGGGFLKQFTVVSEPLDINEMIKNHLIADPRYVLVEFDDKFDADDKLNNAFQNAFGLVHSNTNKNNPFQVLSGSRMRILDSILRFHTLLNHKIMIFCESIELATQIKKLYANSLCVLGRDSEADRAKIFRQFENPKSRMNIFITTKIAETGLNIPAVQVTVKIAPNNSLNGERQRSGRSERDHRPVAKPGHAKAAYNYQLIEKNEKNEITYESDGKTVKNFPKRMALVELDGLSHKIFVIKVEELMIKLQTATQRACEFFGTPSPLSPLSHCAGYDAGMFECKMQRARFLLSLCFDLLLGKSAVNDVKAGTKTAAAATAPVGKATSGDPNNAVVREIRKRNAKRERENNKKAKRVIQNQKTTAIAENFVPFNSELLSLPPSSSTTAATSTAATSTAATSTAATSTTTHTADSLVFYDDTLRHASGKMLELLNQICEIIGLPTLAQNSSISDFFALLKAECRRFNESRVDFTSRQIISGLEFSKMAPSIVDNIPWQARAEDFYF